MADLTWKSAMLAIIIVAGLILSPAPVVSFQTPTSTKSLIDFSRDSAGAFLEPGSPVKARIFHSDKVAGLRLESDERSGDVSLTLKAPGGAWDLSLFMAVAMEVRNIGSSEVLVTCSLNDSKWVDGAASIPSGESRTLQILLKRGSPPAHLKDILFGMNGLPGGYVQIWDGADPASISRLRIRLAEPEGRKAIELRDVRAEGTYEPPTPQSVKVSLFPFVDAYGQYKTKEWPGKIKSVEDFAARRSSENADIQQFPSPEDWDRYGGWAGGPLLAATGHFRTEKYRGKWWLVDPEGRLFWSHGIDCVRIGEPTPISGREHYFESLPVPQSPLALFYGTGDRAAHGYYLDHTPFRTFDFAKANLERKYGEEWLRMAIEIPHRRLRSWGMNTIANWSEESIYLLRRTPYVGTLHTGQPPIQGSKGNWGRFPDPFAPEFRQALRQRLRAEADKSAGDPWCIGYFIDNEMTWGSETSLALAVLASPSSQAAKQAFIAELKSKYQGIEALNAKWGARYASWQALSAGTAIPDEAKAHEDLVKYNARLAEEYFRICKEALAETAPGALYLGCRFDFHFYPDQLNDEWVLRIAARYCDVISFNRYRFSASGLTPPQGIDKPMIIGEYHFGALDRGMLHTGLRSVADQQQRGDLYRSYVMGALRNPYMVGAHWFQYQDQPLTGRSDGENYQIGFLDIADTPYSETVRASRAVGAQLYKLRHTSR